ncbi:hypothetical protein [Gracilibacillus salinarum]|uniref:Phage tail protein n=1 Tax=Gracilibacillus salinarum TaxID=2932255 RepID=A0ABY4GP91_9BACI|nr:hypothetical protein [Gracilibacillus salinarum]UOQ86201.1 hypothetical protein MUN87_04700 [Gracilibacillus salinarum]
MNYTKITEHGRLGKGITTLVHADTLTPVFAKGGTLTITEAGYKLTPTNSAEVIRSGSQTDAFEVVEALDFDIEQLTVVDETKGVTLPLTDYSKRFRHGYHWRDGNRKFFAHIIKDEEAGATGFGITEKANGYTYAIHSIYVPKAMTRKERSQYLVEYLAPLTDATEYARVQAIGANNSNVTDWLGVEYVRIQPSITAQTNIEETELLAKDALARQSTITERLQEPIKYTRKDVE